MTMLLEYSGSLARSIDMNELHVSCDARNTHGLPIILLNDYIL